jgi:ubiquinone/menaquinone biosynthesis C-methylase UbiE
MKIEYQETTNDLATRIDIHSKYGSRDIDKWMIDLIQLQPGMKILDVGCGAGKQCFSYFDFLNGKAEITGGDVNHELLEQAKKQNSERKTGIRFLELDFNKKFDFPANSFDFCSCCFAIYYALDVPFTIGEMHRILKPGGRLFTTGPMPENKQLFYEIIKEATGKPIPSMPGSSRYSTEFFAEIKSLFKKADVHIFENPLVFETVEPFLAYTRASLSEDRKLWGDLFAGKDSFEMVISQIETVAQIRMQKEGKLVMTKVVGGFLATK